MALESLSQTLTFSFPANADLSSHQHKFVKISSGKIVIATAAGEDVLGVLLDKPAAADRAALVALAGVCKVIAAETLAAGDLVATNASALAKKVSSTSNGLAIVDTSDTGAATDAVTGSYVMGKVLVGGAVNQTITIHLFGGPRAVPATAA